MTDEVRLVINVSKRLPSPEASLMFFESKALTYQLYATTRVLRRGKLSAVVVEVKERGRTCLVTSAFIRQWASQVEQIVPVFRLPVVY